MNEEIVRPAQEWRANWPTVIASAVGMSIGSLYVYSAGYLVEPLEREFGWSRAAIGSGITVLTLTAALLGPVMGAAVDRFGSRRLAVPGIIAYCLAFAMLSQATQSLWLWWILWFLLALFGIGVQPTVWTTAIVGLFQKSRGLALAVTLSGTSLGSIFVPIATNSLIEAYGWRGVFIGLALIWFAMSFPLAVFFFRGASDNKRVGRVAGPERAMTGPSARQSLLSWRFLALLIAAMSFSLLAMALVVSLVPIFSSHGITRGTATQIAATMGVTAFIGRLVMGYLLDRYDPPLITAFTMALPIVTFALLLGVPGSVPLSFVAVLVMGFALGAEIDAIAFLTSHYFGTRHYGLLFGTLVSGLSVATGSAPLIAGFIFDLTGSYDWLLIGAIPLCLLAAILIGSMGKVSDLRGI